MLTRMYVYEDGDLIGEEDVDLSNDTHISEVMEKYFDVYEEWESEGVRDDGEHMILEDQQHYMINRKY